MSSSALTGPAACPVVQGPVTGGVSTQPAAVEAGGLGCRAVGHRAPEEMAEQTEQVRGLTPGAHGENLVVPQAAAAAATLAGDPRAGALWARALWAGRRQRPARPVSVERPAGAPPAGAETARHALAAGSGS